MFAIHISDDTGSNLSANDHCRHHEYHDIQQQIPVIHKRPYKNRVHSGHGCHNIHDEYYDNRRTNGMRWMFNPFMIPDTWHDELAQSCGNTVSYTHLRAHET